MTSREAVLVVLSLMTALSLLVIGIGVGARHARQSPGCAEGPLSAR